ncbi:branched-chain amino acid aminotransferase, partial [Methanosarcinales archaeon]
MIPVIYVNGEYLPENEAKISLYDHGFLYGDGVFEGIRAYNGRVFRLNDHVDRLYDSARAIALNIPLTKEEMVEAILETLRRNNYKDAY